MSQEVTPTTHPVRILVVNDNVDASLIVSLSLQRKGFSVQRGDSGPQTLSIAEHWLPHIILLDISMPGMDGYETCRRLRQQPWGTGMVLVALTGYGQADDKRRAQEAGFDAHLIKPVDLTTLAKRLTELAQQKTARPAAG